MSRVLFSSNIILIKITTMKHRKDNILKFLETETTECNKSSIVEFGITAGISGNFENNLLLCTIVSLTSFGEQVCTQF